ncbi:NAD(P)/FAD-dependent oxidoreductase [Candidatus Micrarchaeota archaeon]|nr:NAD(P)/FAD-dependent oxidoreductase [Candidatus Micrarchaeota archaeon]
MPEIFDVIVIGAGPAGTSAAMHSAKLGLKTLLLEEHSKIGEPVHCGECLSQLAVKRFGMKLPKTVISAEVKGIKVIFPNRKSVVVKEKGFVLEKDKFEQFLGEKAKQNGAKIQLNCKAEEIKRKENLWAIKCNNNSFFQGKILIDATGANAFTSSKLNLNKRFDSVIGIQYRMQGISNDGFLDFYLWPEIAPKGYLWMIPKSNGKANVGLVTEEKTKAKVFLDKFIKKNKWEKKTVKKTFGGMIPISGPKKTFDNALMLVGDAAGFTSPLFEGGTSLGLESGKFAAQTAKKAIDKRDYSKTTLSEYESLWKKEFPDYNKMIKGKNALYNLNQEELNFFASILPEDITKVSLMDRIKIGFKIWFSKPELMWKGVASATKALGYSRAKHYGW